jgi:hypothetical protein
MEHDRWPQLVYGIPHGIFLVRHVAGDDLIASRGSRSPPGHSRDADARAEQRIDDVTADKTGTAGDQNRSLLDHPRIAADPAAAGRPWP